MINHIPGLTVVHCDGSRKYTAVFDGKLTARKAGEQIKKHGWKMTEDGHYCGRCGLER